VSTQTSSNGAADPLKRVGPLVALILLLVFVAAAIGVVVTVMRPPILADPAPAAPPILICSTSPTSVTAPPGDQAQGTVGTGNAVDDADRTAAPTADVPIEGADVSAATSSPAVGVATVACDADDLVLSPQHRGAYDPNARLTALLAVITPLLTTIVAFYFGQRAGAGEGEAAKQKIVASVMASDPNNPKGMTDLQQKLKERGNL
jgi:hypothetical protein